MEARPVIHPSADALRAFALGKLDNTTASVVMSHLDSCADCRKEVASLSGDDFLAGLRQAQGHSATPAPAKSLADAARAPKPSASQTPVSNLPPELANNAQYEVLRELGRGGMGVVYLAKNKLMDRLEVLKVVNKALLDHPGAVERFLREIRSAAKLTHPNVVAAYSALQLGELLAFAMEYVEGEDLAQLVKKHGPLPMANACYYVQQAALGLQHAFEKKMVHRDIKPQNLMLAREGKKHIVKVLDFGLAKATREKGEETALTGAGAMLGTPDYVAPEQTLDAAAADIRADIYSLGCTLYYLLTGKPPFQGKSLYEVLQAHHSMEAKSLTLVRAEVPEDLAAIVRKMMAKDPAQRYQTPAEVVQTLGAFIKQNPKSAPTKSSPELSAGAKEAESTGSKTAPPTRPIKPLTAVANRAATMIEGPPPLPSETMTEGSITSLQPGESGALRKGPPPIGQRSPKQKWLIGGGIGVGVLLLGLVGLWAGGVFTGKTTDGTLVIQVNEPDADVYVDGEKVSVSWDSEGKKTEVHVKPGSHKVEVKKTGFAAESKEVMLEEGKTQVLVATLKADSGGALAQAGGPLGGGLGPPGTPGKRDVVDPPGSGFPGGKTGGRATPGRKGRLPGPGSPDTPRKVGGTGMRGVPNPPAKGSSGGILGGRPTADIAGGPGSPGVPGMGDATKTQPGQAPPQQGQLIPAKPPGRTDVNLDSYGPGLQKAKEAYEAAMKRAELRMLAALDRVLEALAKARMNAEDRLKLIEIVKAEKATFEKNGRIPWSAPARSATHEYLRLIIGARLKLSEAFDRAIQNLVKRKEEDKAKECAAAKRLALQPKLLAVWSGSRQFFSDGTISGGAGTWSFENNAIIMRWPNAAAKGGYWIDRCNLSPDGKTMAGSNQLGRRITGTLVEDP